MAWTLRVTPPLTQPILPDPCDILLSFRPVACQPHPHATESTEPHPRTLDVTIRSDKQAIDCTSALLLSRIGPGQNQSSGRSLGLTCLGSASIGAARY